MSVNLFKKSDNSLTKVAGNVKGFHYSTTETFTGKYWIDGKQIYSKVINIPAQTAGTEFDIDLSDLSIATPISMKGMYRFSSTSDNYYVPVLNSDEKEVELNVYLGIQNNKLRILTGAKRQIYDGSFVILEYTKV